MRAPKLTRDEVLHRIADVFRRLGYEGSSLSEISKATGLGRASLYHHFPGGKEEMGREVFRWLGAVVEANVIAPLVAQGPPAERLQGWAQGVLDVYSGGKKGCILAALALGDSGETFARELLHAFRAQRDALEAVLIEAGLPKGEARHRAEDALGRIQGALILGRGLGDRNQLRRVVDDLPADLLR
jgi:TetR/AcrR family transcriptional regulator, lmrAB and yxaGH operons repressor